MILIINGISECGKDTFMNYVGEEFDIEIFSTIDEIRQGMKFFGISGKGDRERKAWHLVKKLLIWYNDFPFRSTAAKVMISPAEIRFIVCREPSDIKKFQNHFPEARTILIKPVGRFSPKPKTGDEGVYDMNYDYTILNSGRSLDFKLKVREFVDNVLRS